MASGPEKHFKNYRFEQIPDDSKKGYKNVYKYIGDHYTWDVPASTLKSYKILFAALEVLTIVVFLFTALNDIALNKTGYIVIPSILSICAWIFEVIAVCFFCFLKVPLKEEDYKRIDSTFFITFPLRFICLTLVTAACAIDTVRFSFGTQAILVTLGYLVCAGTALSLHMLFRKLNDKKKVLPAA